MWRNAEEGFRPLRTHPAFRDSLPPPRPRPRRRPHGSAQSAGEKAPPPAPDSTSLRHWLALGAGLAALLLVLVWTLVYFLSGPH